MLSQRFWYKNYVEYNKLGIVIKLNIITDKTIKFNEIDKIKMNDDHLIVVLKSEGKFEFKTMDLDKSDINKLLRILVENSKSKFTDNRTEKNTIAQQLSFRCVRRTCNENNVELNRSIQQKI